MSKTALNTRNATCCLRNLWTKKEVGNTKKAFTATMPSHDVVLLLSK